MPITLTLAWSWFLATLVDAALAGVIVGVIVKPPRSEVKSEK